MSRTCSGASQSFAFSYLVDKFGFSQQFALAASKYLGFKTPSRPDSVIAFLEKNGFSKTQIQKIIKISPNLLSANAEKSLLPKLEFVRSKGVSGPDLIKLLLTNATILRRSIEKQIMPIVNHLSNLLQSHDKVLRAIKRDPRLVTCSFDAYFLANINVLLHNGVPEANIRVIFLTQPRSFVVRPNRFKEIVKEVKEMGFNPLKQDFLLALVMFRTMTKTTLERKFDVYKRWGWSEQEIWEAIRKTPRCVLASEEKIMAIMHFLVNKMNFQSLVIPNQPSVFKHSLEKKIIPRGLYAQELLSKGLLKKFTFSGLFDTSEKLFLRIFVNRYGEMVPELLKLYKEKVGLAIGGKYRTGYF